MPNETYLTTRGWWWTRSAFHSMEGYSFVGLLLVAAWKKDFLIKTYPQWTSTIATSFFTQVISSFFNYAMENRRLCSQERVLAREVALLDAQAFEKEAIELRNHRHWVMAAEKYELAAQSYSRANEIAVHFSKKIETSVADAFISSATCFLFSGNIAHAQHLLNKSRGHYHAHPSTLEALSGLIALLSKKYDLATSHFKKSLKSDPNQDNIYLLYLYLTGKSKRIVECFNLSFMIDASVHRVRDIKLDDYTNFALYYYALSFLENEKYQPVIAILELLILIHKTMPSPILDIQCAYQALYQAYSKLSEQGDCNSLFKLTLNISKEQSIVDIPRGQNYSMNRSELKDKVQFYQRMMLDQASVDLIEVKGIFAPRPLTHEGSAAAASEKNIEGISAKR